MSIVTDETIANYKENGFAVIPNVLSLQEVEDLKQATKDVVNKYCMDMPTSVFADQSRDTYFAESGDKIRGFYEEAAVDRTSRKVVITQVDRALNKIGHALHKFEPTFKQLTMNEKIRDIVLKLTSIQKPAVIQSMIMFKNPKIGGEVGAHRDATFLYTTPVAGRLIGFWIALDEASLENGCLHFLPKSHKIPDVHQRFIRNPDKDSQQLFVFNGDKLQPPNPKDLVAAPVKPGDCVLIDGLVIHQSEPNMSDKPRMAYTFHVVDESVEWAKDNWLQPTDAGCFMTF